MQGLTNQQIPAGSAIVTDPLQVYSNPFSAQQLVNLSFEHNIIHSGKLYAFSRYIGSVAGNATVYMAFEAGNALVHLSAQYRISQDFRWEARTGFAYNADGTVITPLNVRFDVRGNPLYTCAARARHGMTITNPGTVVEERYLPSSGKGIGSQVTDLGIEWIFNKNTQYLFSYVNLTNQAAIFNLLVDFYELNLP